MKAHALSMMRTDAICAGRGGRILDLVLPPMNILDEMPPLPEPLLPSSLCSDLLMVKVLELLGPEGTS